MNKDLLIKLTKLANHNPNDNEANSAARRVCKMLEEANFNLTDTPKSAPQPPKSTPRGNPFTDTYYDDLYRYQKMYEEFLKDATRFGEKWAKTGPKTWNDVHRSKEPEFKSTPPYQNYNWKAREKKEIRKLKCKVCGKIKETKFVGAEEVFECNDCQWTEWTRERVNR
jgi:hypothetical protein